MSTTSTPSKEAVAKNDGPMTPEQQGVFLDLFKQTERPDWLVQASAEKRKALHASIYASHQSRANARKAMAALQNPQQFCTPLLTKALADKTGETLDIRGVVFQHVRSTSSLFGLRKKLVLPIDRDLLLAACENFEVGETLASNYDEQSLIYQPERINGRANKVLSIAPHEFAQLCRTLDLGKRYQTHLNALFEPSSSTGTMRQACTAHAQRCMDVDRHLARMKKHISEDVFRMLGEVVASATTIKLGKHSVACKRLEMLGHPLHGAMLIVAVSDGEYADNPCVLYLPGDPEQPLKEYETLRKLELDLAVRLDSKAFETFLLRFVPLSDRQPLHDALLARLLRPAPGWMQPSQPASVTITPIDVDTDVFAELYRQRAEHVMADARLLVVPTDDEDEKTRLERLDSYKTIGLDIVLFGASFIPVVGEVLMAVSAAELLLGVYHGLESWSAGEQEQATDYFFDTLENLLTMVAFSAGAQASKAAFRAVRTSGFIESLRQVRLSDGKERLWKPDLAPYRKNLTFPTWLKADDRGLREFDGQTYVALDKDIYAVSPDADSGLWVIEGANLHDSYTPLLETNDAGAWRHDSELPEQWSRLRLFRRLGYTEEDIPDRRALQILSVCALDDRVMRQVLIDRMPPPALLIDTVRRFGADQAVSAFITQLGEVSAAALADADLQLRLLTGLKTWPSSTAIQVLDSTGKAVNHFAPVDTVTSKNLTLTLDNVRKGQFHSELLSGLSRAERERLLGSTTTVASEQASALFAKLAQQADLRRRALFDWIYQRGVPVDEGRSQPLRSLYADLPTSVIDELVHYADSSELDELDAGNVPLRLGEEARRFRQVVQVSRAYEGLYLDSVGGIDTDRLVFSTLTRLPGWKGDLYVRLLEWSFYTEEFASIGLRDATQQLLMNAHADRYEVLDAEMNVLGSLTGRTRANYFQALWQGLSQTRRVDLGLSVEDQGAALRQKVTELALRNRALAEPTLGIAPVRPGYVSPMRLADPLLGKASGGLPAQGTTPLRRPAALVRRAQELFPSHSLEWIELFVTSLGPVDVLALRALENMRLELLSITQVLQNWINRETWTQAPDGPRLKVTHLAKTRAAQEILRCWRRETPSTLTLDGRLYELVLPPLRLGELPLINGDFSHVGTLVLDRVGASAGLNRFLHNFKSLRRLSLVGNHLTRLQQAIGAMSRLQVLDLSENRLFLTPASVVELAGLTGLKELNLSSNPSLGRAPDVARMQSLERLQLRNTGISQWPNGSTGLARLQTLDLRDNQITEVPEDVFAAADSLNQGTVISGNPLSAETQRRVLAYQQTSEISLGLIAIGQVDQVQEIVMDLSMSATWLTGAREVDKVLKRILWSSVFAYPDSRPFFNLLSRLRYTADFRLVYRSLSQRVWDVVEAAAEDSALRRTLFYMANVGQISADGSSLVFSDLHVRVLCYRAMTVARGAGGTREGELAQLLRGLFRLQEVERFALKNVISRRSTGEVSLEQAMEISLAYRVGLAERLNLPAQPRDMNVHLKVDVVPQTLDGVYEQVVKLEHSAALEDWMGLQPFWTEYLEGTHQNAYDEVVVRSAAAFGQLDGRLQFSSQQFGQHMNAIVDNYRNDRLTLTRRLTREALQRHPGLPLPAAVENGAGAPSTSTAVLTEQPARQ